MKAMLHIRTISVILILSMAALLTAVACSDSGSTSADTNVAVIQGSVAGGDQQQSVTGPQNAEATMVAAARITADGSFESIPGTETETNASGQFTLEVDVEEASHIAVKAETQGETRYGFISAWAENGNTYTLKPLTTESTAETEVFARVVAEGKAEYVHKSDIEAAISAHAAAELQGNSQAKQTTASALINAGQARVAFASEFEADGSGEKLSTAAELRADAQFEYETSVASSGSGDNEAAFESFLEAGTEAYVMAGFSEANAATMLHMYKEVFLNSSSAAEAHTRSRLALQASVAMDMAARAEAQTAGMSETTLQAMASAGMQLRSEIRSSDGSSSEIRAAFETWHGEVKAAMESDSSVEASAVVTIDSQINASGGPKTVFRTALSGTTGASAVVELYSVFSTSVKSITETTLETGNSSADAETVARMMLLINLAS